MNLHEDLPNPGSSEVDLSKVAALHQKRTLAFVNHFLTINVQFLNTFMKNCEQKLMEFERKLEKVNAAMVLLESKLSSIPELDIPKQAEKPTIEENQPDNKIETKTDTENSQTKIEETALPSETQIPSEYEKFVKMVQVGVPLQAVKLKISLEGLDPEMLEKILK